VILVIIFDAVILFAMAGTLCWLAAWVYVAVRMITLVIGAVFIIRDNPEIINERGRMPLLLGSWWSLIHGILMAAVTIWHTGREDKVLHEELPGYAEYAL
jgi:protein-S-isoprenylcysteine O-methyltransferase Ste14